MKRILISDFIAELKKINNDLIYITECVDTLVKGRTKYISECDAVLIADKLVEESTASELDVRSFNRGFTKLLDGENKKHKYYDGVTVGVWAR
jgi:hypothetical protein